MPDYIEAMIPTNPPFAVSAPVIKKRMPAWIYLERRIVRALPKGYGLTLNNGLPLK
jgi:hypothetical protein